MRQDMCIPCGEGFVNIRVGAIILKDGKLLMVGNGDVDYLYSGSSSGWCRILYLYQDAAGNQIHCQTHQ